MSDIDFKALAAPFHPQDIEWRLQECGKKGDKIWAMCLAYITNRAIMQRLDDVCGPANWKNRYRQGPGGGIICGISVKCGDEWVEKWDGADNTQIEATKGGLSDSMKRAGVQWGIGRYLYNLDVGFAEVLPEGKKGEYRGKVKEGNVWFSWNPPKLPSWAMPSEQPKNAHPPKEAPPLPEAQPEQPKTEQGQHGGTSGKTAKDLTEEQIKYFPRAKKALDTSDVAAKQATIKASSGMPAKGNFPAREGVTDYRELDGKRLEFLTKALEKLAAKVTPELCNECRQPVTAHSASCPNAAPPN
jgi:hypothetical protein